MLQLGWGSVPRPLWGGGADPDAPGATPPSDIRWNWFALLAYSAPLDERDDGRLAVQLGFRFHRPL
jgi:hypothetical protein